MRYNIQDELDNCTNEKENEGQIVNISRHIEAETVKQSKKTVSNKLPHAKFIRLKLSVVLHICHILCDQFMDELRITEDMISLVDSFEIKCKGNVDEIVMNKFQQNMSDFTKIRDYNRKVYTHNEIASRAITAYGNKNISVKVALEAYNAIKKNSFASEVFEDGRGKWKRPSFLKEMGLELCLDNYLRYTNEISLKSCQKWLKSIIENKFSDPNHPARQMKISTSIVHSWLHDMGCIYCKTKKTYYTDRKITEGYVGKAKGIKQILYERGLFKEGMVGHSTFVDKRRKCVQKGLDIPNENDLDMEFVLSIQSDFMFEKSIIQQLIEARGHIFLASVKCHPEMAGSGIEYCWGQSERAFRKINEQSTTDFLDNVLVSLSYQYLPVSSIWSYERRTRDYMKCYKYFHKTNTSENMNYYGLEDMRRHVKSHRNIGELDKVFIKNPNHRQCVL